MITSHDETDIIDQEIREMQDKEVVSITGGMQYQFQSSLFWQGKRMEKPFSDQSKRVEQRDPLFTLQNGRPLFVERNSSTQIQTKTWKEFD